MTKDEVRQSIEKLRERRKAIPSLRDYRPQGGKKPATVNVEELFADLLNQTPEGQKGGETDGD